MATTATAAVAAATFAALYAGHHVGDHVVQGSRTAAAKGARGWTGWAACLAHVTTYTLTQAAALLIVSAVAPLGLTGAVAALTMSAASHAVIDRRWPVRLLIRAKRCETWPEGPYLLDQSLHMGFLLICAVLAAAVERPAATAGVALVAAGLVGSALTTERLIEA
jgi:hypothetical protein